MKDYYEILEVSPKASKEIINKAYSILIEGYNPDLCSSEEEREFVYSKMKDVNEAYKILSDDFLREQYDNELFNEKRNMNNYGSVNNYNNVSNISSRSTKDIRTNRKKFSYNNDNSNNSFKGDGSNTGIKDDQNAKVGTLGSLIFIFKSIFKPRKIKDAKIQREDVIAMSLAIGIVAIILIILVCIPTTREFLKRAFPLFG